MKRTSFLEHVGWTGLGLVYTIGSGGLVTAAADAAEPFTFVQISDSHIGFHQAPNTDPPSTLRAAIEAINALPVQPRFVMHTGDVTHLSKAAEFDTAKQLLASLRAPLFVIPGEHDAIGSDGTKLFLQNFARKDAPQGWYAFDLGGVHFLSIVNVFNFEKMGLIGNEQLDWIRKDLAAQKTTTPIVVFGHVPLYTVYEPWGWMTEDGGKVVAMLQRFDNVTVLNGHIHQVLEHTEGKIRFRTAAGTAYPQPAPGTAAAPGPLKDLPPEKLLSTIGYRTARVEERGQVQTVDKMLG
ncbi:MAG: metallophosphoesterase [Candidatus Eremiobacteraeota bacterium]|nr:metallophosphoesterase [Candidatus Eremiobacteraeota bacterium]